MRVTDFDDLRIEQITSGAAPMTADERAFLVEDTARMEECQHTEDELRALD